MNRLEELQRELERERASSALLQKALALALKRLDERTHMNTPPDINQLDKITVPEQVLVHLNGMPFLIAAGTAIYGRQANYDTAMQMRMAGETARER